jgi:acyl-CoA dehydrogenase
MMVPLERARDLVCVVAAQHAEAVDADGRFPFEALSALRDARLMGAFVPRELGGEGATVSEVASICHLLGRNCGSTGLIYAMHLIQTACIVLHGQTNAWQRDILRQVAADQLLLASATTEGATGGDLGRSQCAVLADGNRFTIEKHGAVISYGDHADMILITARRSSDAAPSDQVLALIPRLQFSLTQTAQWDALGMRGTCSNTYLLRAEGHLDQILPGSYGDIQNDTMTPFAHLTWSCVWLGIAVDALSRARRYLRGHPNATLAQGRLVEANSRLQQMRADIASALRLYEALPGTDRTASLSLLMVMNNLKISVSSGVVQVIQQALMICGIAGYRNDSPYSVGRQLRDALSAALMVSNDRIAAGMGKMVLVQRVDSDLLAGGERH